MKIFENFDKIVKRKFHKKDKFCKNFEKFNIFTIINTFFSITI